MINDYATLVQTVKDYLKTPTLDNYIDLYIQQTEADIDREIRHPYMEAEVQYTLAGNTQALPSDFLELRDINVKLPRGTFSLEYVTPQALNNFTFGSEGTANPLKYTISGSNFVFPASYDGSEVTVIYYQNVPPLTSGNTTNWVIDHYVMLYWYGVIRHAWAWKMDDSNMMAYARSYEIEQDRVKREGRARRLGGQGARVRGV